MRRILYVCILLVVAVLVSGCSQQSQPAVTPAPTPAQTPGPVLTTLVPAFTATTLSPASQKHVDISALQSGSDIIVRYAGGVDAMDLTSLVINIQSYNGQALNEREENPVVGQQYVFPQMGTPDLDVVTVTGIFRDGSEQVLLQTKV
jgi:hypothetical protein